MMNSPQEKSRRDSPAVRLWEPESGWDSAASLLTSLCEAGALDASQAEVIAGGSPTFNDARSMVEELVRREWLTPFQAARTLEGKPEPLGLGPYLLIDLLGEGGMGRVYKARHRVMDRVVALKVIRPEILARPEAVKRFLREVRSVARLAHENIVAAYDAAEVDGRHFLVMEYVEGTDLARLVRERGPLPVDLACRYARQASLGLAHAHGRGLVHRDIKPSNLLATPEGLVKLLDLGLAKIGDDAPDPDTPESTLTHSGAVLGTPDYLAPEQASDPGRPDPRSDQYALGCTLYHLLTGRPPFPGGSPLDKLLRHREIDPPPLDALLPAADRELAAVVRKMTAKRPADRFANASELAEALTPFTDTRGRHTAPAPSSTQLPPILPPDGDLDDRDTAPDDRDTAPVAKAGPSTPTMVAAPGPPEACARRDPGCRRSGADGPGNRRHRPGGRAGGPGHRPAGEVRAGDPGRPGRGGRCHGQRRWRHGGRGLGGSRQDRAEPRRAWPPRAEGGRGGVLQGFHPDPGRDRGHRGPLGARSLAAGQARRHPHASPGHALRRGQDGLRPARQAGRGLADGRLIEEAIAEFEAAIKIDPRSAAARMGRAHWLGHLRRYAESIAEFDRILAMNPKDFVAFDRRGAVNFYKGDEDAALADFNKGIGIFPNYAPTFLQRAILFEKRGDLDRAIADYTKVIALDPKSFVGYMSRGRLFRSRGELPRSLSDFDAAVAIAPMNPDTYRERSRTLIEMGQDERGRADDREADRLAKPPR